MYNTSKNETKEIVTTERGIKTVLCTLYKRQRSVIDEKFIFFKKYLYFSNFFNPSNYSMYQLIIPSEFSCPDELQMLTKHWCKYLQDNHYLRLDFPSYDSSSSTSYTLEDCTLPSYKAASFKWSIPSDFLDFFCLVFMSLTSAHHSSRDSFFDANNFFNDLSNRIHEHSNKDFLNNYEQLFSTIFHKDYLLTTTEFYQITHFKEASDEQRVKLQNSIQNLTFLVCNFHNPPYSPIGKTSATAILRAYTKKLKSDLSKKCSLDSLYPHSTPLHSLAFELQTLNNAFSSMQEVTKKSAKSLETYFSPAQHKNNDYVLDTKQFENLKIEVTETLTEINSIIDEYSDNLSDLYQFLLDNNENSIIDKYSDKLSDLYQFLLDNNGFSFRINRDSVYQHKEACFKLFDVYSGKLKSGFRNFIANINKYIQKKYDDTHDIFNILNCKIGDATRTYEEFINNFPNLPAIVHISEMGLLSKYEYWIFPIPAYKMYDILHSLLKDLNPAIKFEDLIANRDIYSFYKNGLKNLEQLAIILIVIDYLSDKNDKYY